MHKTSLNKDSKKLPKGITVELKDRTFTDVKNIKKFYTRCSKECEYYEECKSNGVFRNSDCRKKANRIKSIYTLVTSILVSIFVFGVFYFLNLSFFHSIACVILGIVVFDIFFTFIEWVIFKLRENALYNKLVRIEKKRDKLAKKQKISNEMEGRFYQEYYDEIENAKAGVRGLKELSDKFDFGLSKEKISKSIKELMEITVELKKTPVEYSKIAYLFEVQLPEFYNVLKSYTIFFEGKSVIAKHGEILEKYVDKFLEVIETQKSNLTSKNSNDMNGEK